MTTMADRDGKIWLDGQLVDWREAKVHVLTHTLHYGMGAFEGVRAYNTSRGTAIFRLAEHTRRLCRSAKILGMPMPYSEDELNAAQVEVLRENGLESAYIRPMIFYGSEGMGLHAESLSSHVMIAAWTWGSYLGEDNMVNGIRVKTSSFTRHHVNSAMTKAKANGPYFNSMLAVTEAKKAGYDEAMLLDCDGFVSEGSGENLFIVRDGVLITPDLTSALDGITRRTILTYAREMGIECVERRITRDEVYIADEAFLTGTAAEVTPMRELDDRTIGEGRRGPVTEALQARYFDQVSGKRDDHADWLTYV
ncbi:branched-chain amino acid aminotransferase [Salinisphaera orenii MK-B5]|uniref:Branched-chain-amino-acid aminotransferase n=1 Tax=Salinisphaera orenii MK-B5 TaxID=856730 RepID=A0A423PUC9_9GAMM|nr:branched-chain amino acid transaminase [Salinisphaera orenii]ROO29207.1 branched-chain amino acid aminotransferase [Salinisphaera orenii MK-B5]